MSHKVTIKVAKFIVRDFTRKRWDVPSMGTIVTHKMGIVVLPKSPSRARARAITIVDGSFECDDYET